MQPFPNLTHNFRGNAEKKIALCYLYQDCALWFPQIQLAPCDIVTGQNTNHPNQKIINHACMHVTS